MPQYLKVVGTDFAEVLLVEYPDSPRYEVRVYCSDIPYDHRTLISTDSIADAEMIFRDRTNTL